MFQQGETRDLSREDMGIITVSQSISTLGMIESANAVALAMFGYNKRDMLNQVPLLSPPPLLLLDALLPRRALIDFRDALAPYCA